MVDPRFLSPCQNKSNPNISQNFAKSLLSFENIVEKELKDMNSASNNITQVNKNPSENSRKKFSSVSDPDEGFYDRSFEDAKHSPIKYFV